MTLRKKISVGLIAMAGLSLALGVAIRAQSNNQSNSSQDSCSAPKDAVAQENQALKELYNGMIVGGVPLLSNYPNYLQDESASEASFQPLKTQSPKVGFCAGAGSSSSPCVPSKITIVTVDPKKPSPIASAIGALPADGGIVLIPPGTYTVGYDSAKKTWIDGINLRSNMILRGSGPETILKLIDKVPPHSVDTAVIGVYALNPNERKHSIIIENLSIDGNSKNQPYGVEQFYRIELLTHGSGLRVDHVIIRRVFIHDSYGDAILASYDRADHILIEDSVLLNSGRNEITIDPAADAIIVRHNTLRNNHEEGAFHGLFGGIDLWDVDGQSGNRTRIFIEENTIQSSSGIGGAVEWCNFFLE